MARKWILGLIAWGLVSPAGLVLAQYPAPTPGFAPGSGAPGMVASPYGAPPPGMMPPQYGAGAPPGMMAAQYGAAAAGAPPGMMSPPYGAPAGAPGMVPAPPGWPGVEPGCVPPAPAPEQQQCPPTLITPPTNCCINSDCCPIAWIEGDWLYWRMKDPHIAVPLVTTGGALGAAGTTILLNEGNVHYDWRNG